MKSVALFVAIVLVLLALPLLLPTQGDKSPAGALAEGAPWQIESAPDGTSRVFGLSLGRSSLEDARKQLGRDAQVALLIAPGESGSVEVYYESLTVGPVAGKMILTLVTSTVQIEQMLQRARKAEYMGGTTRRVELDSEDLALLSDAAVASISFIPSAHLDEQVVLQRFGTPAERIRTDETREHFLYPDKGLDLQLDTKGKELLQYVAPRDFKRLRAPLLNPGPT